MVKECPFCGGKAIVLQAVREPRDMAGSWTPASITSTVNCKECQAGVREFANFGGMIPTEEQQDNMRRKVIAKWNRRNTSKN